MLGRQATRIEAGQPQRHLGRAGREHVRVRACPLGDRLGTAASCRPRRYFTSAIPWPAPRMPDGTGTSVWSYLVLRTTVGPEFAVSLRTTMAV